MKNVVYFITLTNNRNLYKTEKSCFFMEKIEDTKRFLRQIKKARHEIKYNRKEFWNKNSVNFRNSIKTIVSFFKFPEGWTVNIVASRFLLDRYTFPYDKDVWSFSDVVAATKKQGFDIILFFNKTDLEYLSTPALLPIVIHEVAHVYQAAKDPAKYVRTTVDDDLGREYEAAADAEVKNYSDEFRKENVLEKIMYCYDKQSWAGAKKMADYLYKEAPEAFGGGYDQEMKKEEYDFFLKSYEERDIDIFIDYFIESFKDDSSGIVNKIKSIFKKKEKNS